MLREFEKLNFEIGSKKRLKLFCIFVSRIFKDRGFFKLYSSIVLFFVMKLMLIFFYGDGSFKFYIVYDVNVFFIDLNLFVV